ncbi:Na+/H+ antiporter NhaA [Sphaerobacter thermophilus]|uniref:Na(+)/H(+) antiporter NhaA n=1 Tax=Sphaerobacter thermophilus (strain ATCC 49802 / DSM 20745 / KCCM 41009 / NCIMB 13125 / S 6022) TaxID=479434 RepID=D1C581_SPHTD|nr:Na+/H+ antiporter NhaA [Sphaerobacter thermophilus]ACZ39398.1 Na+/H+ antiporter NhaA [Sphaerobacter thermophilus DSM 20745]
MRPVRRVITPLEEFIHSEVSGGIVMLLAAAVALIWANSPWSESYTDLWHTPLRIGLNGTGLTLTLHQWINDGLMAIFFLVVGLEIKRELLVGELASPRQAALPVAAACGGAVTPALIYLALNAGTDMVRGWGVPMATDIAFALGVLALVGSRAPIGLKVFLTALAIVDDLLAVLVIAVFYTSDLNWGALAAGGGILLLLLAANLARVSQPMVYAVLGIGLWFAFLQSGVHATVAGVLLALTIPARNRIDPTEFLDRAGAALEEFRDACEPGRSVLSNERHQQALHALRAAVGHVQPPMQRLEDALHPWVAFLIVPLFALANAGVSLGGDLRAAFSGTVTLGVLLGLVIGKQIGITLTTWLAVRTGLSSLPEGVSWRHLHGAATLGGIGFTMALFIAELAFVDEAHLTMAKLGIFIASLISGILGWILLRLTPATHPRHAVHAAD